MVTSTSPTKPALRRQILQARQSLSLEVWRAYSDRICAHLQASPLFHRSQTILAYSSFRQEPDLSPLFALDKTWGLPRCVDKTLCWHSWSPQRDRPLQTGAYGILEPAPDLPELNLATVDLILVPAVACDRQGYRLGYGGGFYDRLLSQPVCQTIPTIGIIFELAHLPTLPHDPWDQGLQAVCTEAGFFSYTSSL